MRRFRDPKCAIPNPAQESTKREEKAGVCRHGRDREREALRPPRNAMPRAKKPGSQTKAAHRKVGQRAE